MCFRSRQVFFNYARTMVISVQKKISELTVGIIGRMVDAISVKGSAPQSPSRGRDTVSQGQLVFLL